MVKRTLFGNWRCSVIVACLTFTLPILSQSDERLPQFEVASVKPANPNGTLGAGLYTYHGGKIVASQCTVQILLMEAFGLRAFQFSGVPAWAQEDSFDIEAIPSSSSASAHANPASPKAPPNDEQRQMLQALLIDRFHLRFHRANKEGRIYILEKSGKRLALHAPKDRNEFAWAGSPEGGAIGNGTGIAGKNISMSQLAIRLGTPLGRPVIDQTGLEGAFDFEYKTGDDNPNVDEAAALINSLKQLGLRLKSTQAQIEAVVIDHIEKPSSN